MPQHEQEPRGKTGKLLLPLILDKFDSRGKFADAMGWARPYLSRQMNNPTWEPEPQSLERMSALLGMSAPELARRLELNWWDAGEEVEREAVGGDGFLIDVARRVEQRLWDDPAMRATLEEIDALEDEEGRQRARESLIRTWTANARMFGEWWRPEAPDDDKVTGVDTG